MYHPYFRGKQFELIAIRDTVDILATSGFIPIIEPVRGNLSGLRRALEAITGAGGEAIVVVNPQHGDLVEDGEPITNLLDNDFLDLDGIKAGILLTQGTEASDAFNLYNEHINHEPAFIHAGFTDARGLIALLGDDLQSSKHVFFEHHCGRIYRNHFANSCRILLRDGFERRRNADYPELEGFSDLHLTYEDEGMEGFGDFLIVGDEFSDGGGPAYAVAIHLTFVNPESDNIMYVYHFLSDQRDTPTDPAGKFGEALANLVARLDEPDSHIFEGHAVEQFRELHNEGHFPGLGQTKKLSLIHHIETLADFFDED